MAIDGIFLSFNFLYLLLHPFPFHSHEHIITIHRCTAISKLKKTPSAPPTPASVTPATTAADYPNCDVTYPDNIGNGICDDEEYNVEECGWDGGDCAKPSLPTSSGTSFLVPTLQKLVSFSVILHVLWL